MEMRIIPVILCISTLLSSYLKGQSSPVAKESPEFTRGLYINAYRAADSKYMKNLLDDFGTLINTLVIDMKDSHGQVTYTSDLQMVKNSGAQGFLIKDLKKYVKQLKSKGYYLVGRIVVFRDPVFARYRSKKYAVKISGTKKLWKDESGFIWVDPFCEIAWKYNIDIAEEVAEAGFDEIQFDYARFPSPDGEQPNAYFPFKKKRMKEDAILGFLSKARERLEQHGVNISIAIFGYTAWHNHLPREGQHFYEMGKRVDFVYPMLYPSHFADNFLKNKTKEKRTYNIVFKSIKRGDSLLKYTDSELVAYIQGFNWKQSQLGKDFIGIQMKAVEDADSKGWIVWNAKGEYKETFFSLVNHTIKLYEPEYTPRFNEVVLTFGKNENKSKRSYVRGIEAVLHW
jgi:hypothetical protein